jgi:hypothetical protein
MRRLLLIILLTTACHAPVTITTPQGQLAYTADQVVLRVNELMNASIAANSSGSLSTNTTRVIVKWCVAADTTLASTPNGWQQTLITGWAQTKAQLPAITNPAILAAMGAVDAVLAVTQ